MKNDFTELLMMVLIVVLCASLGFFIGIDYARTEAIRAGAARWTINPTNGVKNIEWNTNSFNSTTNK